MYDVLTPALLFEGVAKTLGKNEKALHFQVDRCAGSTLDAKSVGKLSSMSQREYVYNKEHVFEEAAVEVAAVEEAAVEEAAVAGMPRSCPPTERATWVRRVGEWWPAICPPIHPLWKCTTRTTTAPLHHEKSPV